jgi:general secretion pathway protein A
MRSPFRGSPNPTLMLPTGSLQVAIDKIRFMISERQGLALILGDNGMGKSTVLRYLHADYSAEGYTTGLINQTEFPSPYAFLKAACAEFGIEARRSQYAQHSALEEWLIGEFKANRTVILFVDEGQRFDSEKLEVVRSLLNFETYDDKLLQIVMAGTLELRDRILAKRNKGFRSRVFAPCMLNAMSESEVREMIAFRCKMAGAENPFTDEACRKVYAISGGVPRSVVSVCAYAWKRRGSSRCITEDMISEVETEAAIG